MYAIVNIYGRQYRVAEKDRVKVANINEKVGQKVEFDQVLLVDDGKKISVGQPVIKDATVKAEILEHGRDRKVLIYKKKRRKGYQRKNGHRQDFSLIQISKISVGASKKKAPTKDTGEATTEPETGKE